MRVRSVQEISRTEEHLGVFYATAYKMPGTEERIRFDIPKESFERRTGVTLGDGKMREIKGNIDGMCEFKLTHSGGKSEHLFIFAPKEATGMFEPGSKHDLTVTSVEEKTTFTIPYSEAVTRLTLQKRVLESAGIDMDGMKNAAEGDRIVELTMRNLSHEGEPPKKLYTRVNAKEGVVVLNIGRAGAKEGDRMELVKARTLSNDSFAKEFNEHRGKETQNTRLISQGEKLEMEIDGKRFEMKGTLKTQNLQVFMSAEMQPFKRDIRFWFDGQTITPKFGQSWRIQSFSRAEEALCLTYTMGNRTVSTYSDSRHLLEPRMNVEHTMQNIQIIGSDANSIRFVAEDSFYSYVYGRFSDGVNAEGAYMKERGKISEDICAAIASKAGVWTELQRYPRPPRDGGGDRGPDSIMRNKETGELFLWEFKWWRDVDKAIEDATQQVQDYCFKNPTYKGERVAGGYIGVLDWKLKNKEGNLRVKRVC